MKRAAFCLLALLALQTPLNTPALAAVNSLDFLPPAPEQGSPDAAHDEALYQITRGLKGGERWNQATFDADYTLDGNAGLWFEESLGLSISKDATPALYRLISIMYREMDKANHEAKAHYQRVRPYVLHEAFGQTCAPGDEEELRRNDSYPSGHSTRGWGMALLLAELAPEREAAILKRGYEIGQSRVICGFHWQSDVDAGRMVGAAVYARLHNDPRFARLMEEAQRETEALRAAKK